MRNLLLAALCLIAIGCSSRERVPEDERPQAVCTLEARAALVVTVVDAVTGRNLAPDANVRVTDGSHAETLQPIGAAYAGAYERAATYTVVVSLPGYQQWQRIGVTVGRDECHVVAQQIEARLDPRP